ncbi:hypothetical protein [Rickettsia endosymbiont of Rhinocyllus conicus]
MSNQNRKSTYEIVLDFTEKEVNKLSVIAKVKGTTKLHEKGTREFGVT